MATNEGARKGVKELEQEITCPICHDQFQEPKIFACCHYYCKGCVEALARRAGASRPFACPECRMDILIPNNDPDQLPTAFFVNRIKELYTSMKKALGEMEAECELCTGSKATAFCRQCAEFICDKCTEAHHRMKTFNGHKVVTLEELKQGGAKLPIKKSPSAICKVHDEHMKIYCYKCHHLICRDCVIDEHTGHKYEFVKKAILGVKQKLADSLVPLRDIQASMNNASKAIESAKLDIKSQGTNAAANIEQSIQDLHNVLEQHKQKMLEKTSSLVKGKLEALTVQKKSINMGSGTIQSLVEFVERNIENATEEELVSIHTQLLNRIDEEINKHHKSRTHLVPVEVADIVAEVECAEELKKSLEIQSKVTSNVKECCNLNPDILALLQKLPEGKIPGVQYNPNHGCILLDNCSSEEEAVRISTFQMKYRELSSSYKMEVDAVEIPDELSDHTVKEMISTFDVRYSQCVFALQEDP